MVQLKSFRVVAWSLLFWWAAGLPAAASDRALPVHLESHLVQRSSPIVARYDWQALRGLPPVRRLMTTDPKDLQGSIMVIGPPIDTVRVLGLDEAMIEEIWVAMTDPIGSPRDTAWVATSLDKSGIESRMEAAGWTPFLGEQGVFARSEDVELTPEDRDALEAMAEGEREAALARLLRSVHRVAVMEDGWLYLAPPFAAVPRDLRRSRDSENPSGAEKPQPVFPFDGLLEFDPPLVCVMAIDTPGNDGTAENDDADGVSLDAMRRRLGALQGLPVTTVAEEIGDFLLTLSEVDGGLAVDVLARRADGGGEEATERFLQFMVLILRLGVTYAGPSLAHELGDAGFTAAHGEVRGEAVVSLASIEDALEAELERRREIRELTEAVNEIERDIERRRAVSAP